jgi:hypothetical protein
MQPGADVEEMMSLPDDQGVSLAEDASTPAAALMPASPEATADGAETSASVEPAVEDILRVRLSEELDAALESPDPVAGLDKAVQTVADELSRHSPPEVESENGGPDAEMAGAIETLVRVALEMDDPVAALEEGMESLAEALAARDLAQQEWQQAAEELWVDRQAAYRHARFHRVNELIDVGYGLDQAVAVTNANEAEIRERAAAAGSDPMEAIYRYAVLNGYQGYRSMPSMAGLRSRSTAEEPDAAGDDPSHHLAALAGLSDEAFAEATKGDRWQKLLQR